MADATTRHRSAVQGRTGQIGRSDRSDRCLGGRTGQTGAMVLGSASQPQLAPLPTSADYSLEHELADFVPPYMTKSYGEPPFPPLLPKDVWDDWLRANPQYATQTMSTTDLATHRFGQTSTGNYEADLARMKEDLADMFKEKLGFIVGRSRLYQRPYIDAFDLISYPAGWRVPDFVKFSDDDN